MRTYVLFIASLILNNVLTWGITLLQPGKVRNNLEKKTGNRHNNWDLYISVLNKIISKSNVRLLISIDCTHKIKKVKSSLLQNSPAGIQEQSQGP